MYSRINPYSNEEDSKHFEAMWQSSKQIRDRLKELFYKDYERLFQDDENVDNMASPNWATEQAFRIGQRKAFRKIIDYLDQEV